MLSAETQASSQNLDNAKPKSEHLSRGGKNLIWLGLGAMIITFITTFIALKIYHDSGDIYLDRSRPGFLPEKEEAEEERDDADFTFSESGKITEETIDDLLDNLKKELDRLNEYSSDPFGSTPISDETLGL